MWFSCVSEVFISFRNVEGLWLTFSPFAPLFPGSRRVFRFEKRRLTYASQSSPLVHFNATSASVHPDSLPILLPYVDLRTNEQAPRMSFSALQHLQMKRPPFSPLFPKAFENRYPDSRRFRFQGLATLIAVSARLILESLFQPSTLLGFALRSISPSRSLPIPFGADVPFLHFLVKPQQPHTGASTFYRPRKPFPLLLPKFFTRVRDKCSLELSGLLGSPSSRTM